MKPVAYPQHLSDVHALTRTGWVPCTQESHPTALAYSGLERLPGQIGGWPWAVASKHCWTFHWGKPCAACIAMSYTCSRFSAAALSPNGEYRMAAEVPLPTKTLSGSLYLH